MMMMTTKMCNQRNCRTVVGYFRPNGKCFSFNGSFLILLILVAGMAQQSFARPNQDDELAQPFDVGDDSKDVDNSEMRRVKPQEDHPIIIYKEDFVGADNAPRRYKDIAHRRRHKKQNFTDVIIEEKHDKTLFDIIPDEPLIVPEDMELHGQSHMRLVPLIKDFGPANEDQNEEENAKSKKELQKRPKKFHRRIRRSTLNGDHSLYKRNPYFRQVPKLLGEGPAQVQYVYVKHAVAGKKHNGLDIPVPGPTAAPTTGPAINEPISFENRVAADENDRVIFSSGRRTSPRTTASPESIFRDPRPSNFDFSFMNPQRSTTARTPIFTRRPATPAPTQEESIFRNPRPENFDFSFMRPQGQQTAPAPAIAAVPTSRPPVATTQAGISQCVWAIVNCCSSRNTDIRYTCFEQNGCYGAFWGLNPCADNVKDNIVNLVAEYYN